MNDVAGSGAGALLEVRDVTREYRLPRPTWRAPVPVVHALAGVSLDVCTGERLGVVGESGSGKSTLARLLVGLDRPTSGAVRYEGIDISRLPEKELRFLRRDVQLVFQDPMGSLNPRMTVRRIVQEPLKGLAVAGDHDARVDELLDAVGLPRGAADRYPHQFSGGQRQRIAIARALAPHPQVLVADEPVSALDVSVRAQVLNLLLDLVDELALTLVFVSHDLGVVRFLCDRIAVLHRGRLVESGPTERVYDAPVQPYTKALLAAVPTLEGGLPPLVDPR